MKHHPFSRFYCRVPFLAVVALARIGETGVGRIAIGRCQGLPDLLRHQLAVVFLQNERGIDADTKRDAALARALVLRGNGVCHERGGIAVQRRGRVGKSPPAAGVGGQQRGADLSGNRAEHEPGELDGGGRESTFFPATNRAEFFRATRLTIEKVKRVE